MLEKIIKKRNDDIAYKTNTETINYKELFDNAMYYGDLIKRQGTSPVILYGHKSINMFTAIFATLYSGRAYIPIDLCTPLERIEKIIEYTNSNIIITDESINLKNIEILKINELTKYENCPIKKIENDIAYIIFTSGSTGIPKGVPISKDNLMNFIEWISSITPLSDYKNVKVLNQASFSFDLSVADIFYSIYNGHTLVALDKTTQENYNDIFKVMDQNNINMIVSTPTFIKLCMINKEFNSNNFKNIKCIYFCGEQLEIKLVKQLYERFPKIKIINAYGPTEATSAVSATVLDCNQLEENLLPCGDILTSATDIIIENDEIVLRGKSVFKGYLGNDVGGYYKDNGLNCFKTGDIGFIKNNKLYCRGRKDSQIKYKGYRIELNDIEFNIKKINGVCDCAVIAKYKDEFNVKLIKAFVVLEENLDIEYVQKELKKLIPQYMMPKIVKIDELPVSCNGKIDRKQLINI